MGILDGIVEWIAEQVMHGLDLVTTSVLERWAATWLYSSATSPPQRPCIKSLWRWLSASSC